MRDIEFRGKVKGVDKWAFGSLVVLDSTPWIYYKYGEDGIVHMELIPETVGQYTGLKDKNGEKIFEGDIVKEEYDCSVNGPTVYIEPIIWKNGGFEFNGDPLDFIADDPRRFEVISNIHDNPELLEKEKPCAE